MPSSSVPSTANRLVRAQFPLGGTCRIGLVGEAPSDREVERGEPFVGPSGQVLDAMLRTAGITRELCYVGNVFECQLEDNSLYKERIKRGGEAWKAIWTENVNRLASELALCQPTVVVPLGGTALLALAGTTSIAQLRGNVRYGEGEFSRYKLLPTFHPEMVLKQWTMYSVCIGDLLKAERQAEMGPSIIWPQRVLNIAPSLREVEESLEKWTHGWTPSCGPLSCDIETGWGQIRGVSFSPNQTEALYVPFIWLDKLNRSYWQTAVEEKRALLAVKAALESPVPKLGQNFANYDVHWLLTKLGIRPQNYTHDLRLLHKALYPELPASLAFMGSSYSEQGTWKNWARHGSRRVADEDKRDA